MKHEIQGGRKYYKNYREQSMNALSFREPFRKHVHQTMSDVAKRYLANLRKSEDYLTILYDCCRYRKRKNLPKNAEITFVGVHNRRTDYLEFRRKRLGLDPLYEDYFEDAMEYYREEYDHPAFLYVSDEMEWGAVNLKELAERDGDIFFVGCGNTDDPVCVGQYCRTIIIHFSQNVKGFFLMMRRKRLCRAGPQ